MEDSNQAWGKSEDAGNNSDDPKPARRWADWLRMAVVLSCWLYVGLGVAFWVIMRFGADRWWVATVMMFGPRWVLLVPLVLLIPAALLIHWRSIWVLGIGAAIVLGPVMGFHVPWRRILSKETQGLRVRVVTCNIHRYWLSGAAMGDLIATTSADVVALQEWSSRHDAVFDNGEWHTQRDGELFLASRYPIRKIKDLVIAEKEAGIAVCYQLQTPGGPVYLVNLHLMSPHLALDAVIAREPSAAAQIRQNSAQRLEEAQIISRFAADLKGPVLLTGDFNMPTDSTIYRQCWSQFTNAFCTAGTGFGSTYYTRLMRTRIDHILGANGWQCRQSWVGPEVGSPHRPVIAEMEWFGASPGSSEHGG